MLMGRQLHVMCVLEVVFSRRLLRMHSAVPDKLHVLRRQVAANNRGIQLVGALIKEYNLDVVHAYMGFIQASSAAPYTPSLFKQCMVCRRSHCG